MADLNLEMMSQKYYDILKELGNIGAGNATTALAQMLQCKVDMSVPQVKLLDFKDVATLMGGEEQIMVFTLAWKGIVPEVSCFFWKRDQLDI